MTKRASCAPYVGVCVQIGRFFRVPVEVGIPINQVGNQSTGDILENSGPGLKSS